MKSKLLLPNRFKWIGLILLIPFALLGVLFLYADFTLSWLQFPTATTGSISASNHNFTDELALTGVIVSLMLIAFAREKEEDEFIHLTRLECWQWSVIINFALLVLATWLLYDFAFLYVMIYNMLAILVIFIVRFQWLVYRNKKASLQPLAL